MESSDSGSYRDRLVDRLRALVDSRGYSMAAVEKELARGRGYVSDALRGDKKLTVEVVLEVLAAVNVPPREFFSEQPIPVSPNAPRRRGRRPTRLAVIADAAPPPPPDTLCPLLRAMLVFLAQRGLLRPEDLEDVRRELSTQEPTRSESSSEAGGRPEGSRD